MQLSILFILAGVVVILAMLIWPRIVRLIGMDSDHKGRRFHENFSRSPLTRRWRAFWIVYLILLFFVIVHAFFQVLSEEAGSGNGEQLGLEQQDSNRRIGVMSEKAEN